MASGIIATLVALVIGLQGRFAEAESIVKADLPADEAVAALIAAGVSSAAIIGRIEKPGPGGIEVE